VTIASLRIWEERDNFQAISMFQVGPEGAAGAEASSSPCFTYQNRRGQSRGGASRAIRTRTSYNIDVVRNTETQLPGRKKKGR